MFSSTKEPPAKPYWGDEGFDAGTAQIQVPAAGPYWVFVGSMGWDAETFGEFAAVSIDVAP